MRASLGAIAMSPMEEFGMASNIDVHVRPPLVVFHSPPVAKPIQTVSGSSIAPSMSSTRPPIVAGPIERKTNPRSIGSVAALTGGGGGGAPPGACASAMAPARAQAEAIRIEPRTRKSSLVMAVFLSRLRSQSWQLRRGKLSPKWKCPSPIPRNL